MFLIVDEVYSMSLLSLYIIQHMLCLGNAATTDLYFNIDILFVYIFIALVFTDNQLTGNIF